VSLSEKLHADHDEIPRVKRNARRAPRLDVSVTAEVIDGAVPRDSGYCMLAEAIKATMPEVTKISVDLQTIRFTDPRGDVRYTYLTPRRCQVALVNFDQGVKPEPFTFQLRNGQVTRSTGKRTRKPMSDAQRQQRKEALSRARLRRISSAGQVPERVGGRTPPLQKAPGGVPFSRVRAFGLRLLSR